MDPVVTHSKTADTALDFSSVPVVDNHCHPTYVDDTADDPSRWRGYFAEDFGLGADPSLTRTTLHYRWSMTQLAGLLGCEPTEEAVMAARNAMTPDERISRFLGAAGIDHLLVDEGFPPPELVRPMEDALAPLDIGVRRMQRVEQLAERLVADTKTFEDFDEQLRAELASARDRGLVALKSVVAYRSGLDVEEPDLARVRRAVEELRHEPRPRIRDKALADYVVHATMSAAQVQELPVQFHTGYGDSDVDLARADPFLLRPVLQRYPGTPVVLLHGSYPYTRHAAVLAATYANAFVDISFVVPFVHETELQEVVRQALAAAPISRVMYSSDAFGLAEHYWLGAVRGRTVLAAVLSELVAARALGLEDASHAGVAVLRDNARRVYGLG